MVNLTNFCCFSRIKTIHPEDSLRLDVQKKLTPYRKLPRINSAFMRAVIQIHITSLTTRDAVTFLEEFKEQQPDMFLLIMTLSLRAFIFDPDSNIQDLPEYLCLPFIEDSDSDFDLDPINCIQKKQIALENKRQLMILKERFNQLENCEKLIVLNTFDFSTISDETLSSHVKDIFMSLQRLTFILCQGNTPFNETYATLIGIF